MKYHRLDEIRESEKKSHIETYTKNELYENGSWLPKPIKTVLDLIPLFEDYEEYVISENTYDLVIAVSASVEPQFEVNLPTESCRLF